MSPKKYNFLPVLTFMMFTIGIFPIASALLVSGIVQDHNNVPLGMIEVRLYNCDVPDFSPVFARSQTTTDDKGQFALESDTMGDALVVLNGKQGDGRIRIEVSEVEKQLILSYPVRTEIVLLHDNDMHFNFNCVDEFRTRIETYRKERPNVFLLNAGDIVIRHADRWPLPGKEGYYTSASHMMNIMNSLHYDAMTVGNHELDYIGTKTREVLESATFPILGANIVVTTERYPQLQSFVVLKTEERYSIGVLGLSNCDEIGIKSLDPVATATEYQYLADENDVFVALTHIGDEEDRRLAKEFTELDIIIGGHTHAMLKQAEMIGNVLYARSGGPPGGHPVSPKIPKHLGIVTIVLENGKIVEKSGQVETFTPLPIAINTDKKIATVP